MSDCGVICLQRMYKYATLEDVSMELPDNIKSPLIFRCFALYKILEHFKDDVSPFVMYNEKSLNALMGNESMGNETQLENVNLDSVSINLLEVINEEVKKMEISQPSSVAEVATLVQVSESGNQEIAKPSSERSAETIDSTTLAQSAIQQATVDEKSVTKMLSTQSTDDDRTISELSLTQPINAATDLSSQIDHQDNNTNTDSDKNNSPIDHQGNSLMPESEKNTSSIAIISATPTTIDNMPVPDDKADNIATQEPVLRDEDNSKSSMFQQSLEPVSNINQSSTQEVNMNEVTLSRTTDNPVTISVTPTLDNTLTNESTKLAVVPNLDVDIYSPSLDAATKKEISKLSASVGKTSKAKKRKHASAVSKNNDNSTVFTSHSNDTTVVTSNRSNAASVPKTKKNAKVDSYNANVKDNLTDDMVDLTDSEEESVNTKKKKVSFHSNFDEEFLELVKKKSKRDRRKYIYHLRLNGVIRNYTRIYGKYKRNNVSPGISTMK